MSVRSTAQSRALTQWLLEHPEDADLSDEQLSKTLGVSALALSFALRDLWQAVLDDAALRSLSAWLSERRRER
jgi:hypothetical protein